jgi:aquaporin Z
MFNSKVFTAELIGTFALVFIGPGLAASGAGPLPTALGFGFVVIAFAYAYGSISGTHLNPAVTFGQAVSGTVTWGEAVVYWIAQFLGAILATWSLKFFVFGNSASNGLGATHLAGGITMVDGLVIEAVLTFFLVNTILHTAKSNFGGLAAGSALVFCVLFGFGLTGASLNPARSFGPALFTNGLASADFWVVYFVGPLVGAALAAFAHRSLGPSERMASPMPAPAKSAGSSASKSAARTSSTRRK